MKRTLFTIISLLIVYTLSGQDRGNSGVGSEKRQSGAGLQRRLPTISRPHNLSPQSDNPFGSSFGVRRETIPQPEITPQEHEVVKPDLVGAGKVAEEDINPWGYAPNQRYLNRWFRDITGFRSFLDYGFTFGVGKNANHRVEWFGTFGYQFNPIFFVGVGQSYLLSVNKQESTAPTYGNLRVNFLDENTTPYLDFKAGYSFLSGQGVFINPNIGISFGKNKRAWNLGLGYSFQRAKMEKDNVCTNYNFHGISFRVTYEFSIFK